MQCAFVRMRMCASVVCVHIIYDPLQQNQECVTKYNFELLAASDKQLEGLSNGTRINDLPTIFAEL